MSAKAKKIVDIVTNILIILVVVFALIVSITSITAKANGGVPDLFGYTAFSIQTDSMKPTIDAGDYIFGEKSDGADLQVGDVITFFTIIQDKRVVNTHRIVDISNENGLIYYKTQGDNNPEPDEALVAPGDVISVYTGTSIPFLGAVMDFLGTSLGFFLFIVLPVLLYTMYQVYKLIVVIIHNQKVKALEGNVTEPTEEMKQAVIAEYLAKQKAEAEATEKNNESEQNEDQE